MISLATGIDYVDLNFLGYPNIIATAVLHGPGGVALIDPGPSTSLTTLRSDAGAQRYPDRGRPPDPADAHPSGPCRRAPAASSRRTRRSRCSSTSVARRTSRSGEAALERRRASTARTWIGCGASSCRFPASGSASLKGGETHRGRRTRRWRSPTRRGTPPITSATSSRRRGIAFVGDTAGIRRGTGKYVMPASPPPDVDLELWRESEANDPRLGSRHAVPHAFRPVQRRAPAFPGADEPAGRVEPHRQAPRGRRALTEEEREEQFVADALLDLRRIVGVADAEQYSRAGSIAYSWQGLARYWRKRPA